MYSMYMQGVRGFRKRITCNRKLIETESNETISDVTNCLTFEPNRIEPDVFGSVRKPNSKLKIFKPN